MHTLKLNDLELTALMIHFEGQNEMNCEARANDDYNTPLTTREIITDKVSSKVYDLYYKTSIEQAAPTFLQEIVSNGVTSAGYEEYEVELDENNNARTSGIYLYLSQTRPSGGDNTDTNDNFGLAEIGLVYGPVTTQEFTPASNATLPGNEGTCGPDSGLNVLRKTCTASESNIRFSDGTFSLSTSTPISVTATATPTTPIPLITRYHRAKYLIKAF